LFAFWPVGALCEAGADEAHRHRVAGEHQHPSRVVAYELGQSAADLDCGMSVVGEGEDAPGVFALDSYQVGNAVNQHLGLARTGPGQHQHVGALAVVSHEVALGGVLEALHDVAPGLRRGLPAKLRAAVGQPAF